MNTSWLFGGVDMERWLEFKAAHLEVYRRDAPGFEQAYLMLSAPQLGVRHSRRLVGVKKVMRAQWASGELDGLLACGRHISCDPNSHSFLRESPQCWATGQAAGTAAALAAGQSCALEGRSLGFTTGIAEAGCPPAHPRPGGECQLIPHHKGVLEERSGFL